MQNDINIRNTIVADGTGKEIYRADVAIRGDKIHAIGDLKGESAKIEIDAQGYCLSPGFIDVHAHDDTNVIRMPEMLAKISQGVTTVIVGNCGISASPVILKGHPPDPMNLLGQKEDFAYPHFSDYAREVTLAKPSVNVAALIGHTSLRNNHMDQMHRPASHEEIEAMRVQLEQSLRDGAIGFSTGLAYHNAREALLEEVLALVETTANEGGIYTTHMRTEYEGVLSAMWEAFDTAEAARAPLVISHLKCAGVPNWGNANEVLRQLELAAKRQSINCDCYPYSAGSSTLDLDQVTDTIEIFITWSEPHPQQARKTLKCIATEWELSLHEAAAKLQPAGAVYHHMFEEDVQKILKHPLTMVGSDGLPNDPFPHPRLWGTFPRVLGNYCRDLKLFDLAEAVHKMTGLSAGRFGLKGRGLIREGAFADLTLFDPKRIEDTATYENPEAIANGIELVIVNGVISYRHAKLQARAGRMLKRENAT